MGALVQYRDLPGGPTELRLCDELSRHCMCSSCGMLSMSMMQDTNKHMFCETCLRERSDKYGSEHIYCKYENQEVSIFEMFQANDLITVIRDQYVFCPNPECKEPVTLEDLKEHYIQCKPTVTCQTCHRQVQTADWSDHIEICNKQEACKSPSTEAIPKQPRSNDALSLPKQSPPPKMDSIQNSRQTSTSLYLSRELQQTQHLLQNPGNESQENTKPCPYCQRKVKERNLELHMTKCPQAPQSCVYCEEKIIKTELNHHVQMCKKNPDNCPKPEPGKPKRVSKETGAQSPFAHGEKKASEKAKNSTSNGAKQHSKNTRRSSPTTTSLHKNKLTYFPMMSLDEGKTAKSQAEPVQSSESPKNRSYSVIKTTLLKNKSAYSPSKPFSQTETMNSQGPKPAHSHNRRSNSPTGTARRKNRGTCIFPRALDEVETTNCYGPKVESAQSEDNWSYSTSRSTHFENVWKWPSAKALDETETTKSHEERLPTKGGLQHDSAGIPVLPALSVPRENIVAWFRKLESYFSTSGVCGNRQKYLIMARSLTPQVQEAVEDILACPPRIHAYECLLISLFRRNMSAMKQCRRERLRFHEFVQQLPFELRVKFESHCMETVAISAGLRR